jgi:hypothetical protein
MEHDDRDSTTRRKDHPEGRPMTAVAGRVSLEKLIDAHRPLLFCRMTRMLRGDGTMSADLQHGFRFFQDLRPARVPVSDRRWRAALLRSRLLRARRAH